MIHVDFNPEALPGPLKAWWADWESRAEQATRVLIQKWEAGTLTSADFDAKLWGELKAFLLDHVFYGKCAYCETHLGQSRQPGDADHFRPKGGANYKEAPEVNCKRYIRARADDQRFTPNVEIEHPGYFWLAYNWKNLLPACKECNSGKGKKEQFPVQAAKHQLNSWLNAAEVSQLKGRAFQSDADPNLYYLAPEDLDERERPYLLHPYFGENPVDHIEFDPAGNVRPKKVAGSESAYGKQAISAYNLWDEDLRQARQDAQQKAYTLFLAALNYFLNILDLTPMAARRRAKRLKKIKLILDGKTPFSAAQVDYLRELGWL